MNSILATLFEIDIVASILPKPLPTPRGDVMPGLDVGDHVADLTFLRSEGTAVNLSEFPGPLLLVFLRHLR